MSSLPTPDEEAARLLTLHGGDTPVAMAKLLKLVSDQFSVIQARSQLLLTLSTLTFTVTGFSGPNIARTSELARILIVTGIVFVLLSTVTILVGGLRVRWLTQMVGADSLTSLQAMLAYRNAKSRLYRVELLLLAVGLSCYVSSVILYLLQLEVTSYPL